MQTQVAYALNPDLSRQGRGVSHMTKGLAVLVGEADDSQSDPDITDVPEEDKFVCPGKPAKKTPPPRKRLEDWLQIDAPPPPAPAAPAPVTVSGLDAIQHDPAQVAPGRRRPRSIAAIPSTLRNPTRRDSCDRHRTG